MLTGGCQCGAVRYACDAAPLALYVCHCLECRHQSGSAFGMSLEMPPGTIRVTKGRAALLDAPRRQRPQAALRLLPRLRLAPLARAGERCLSHHQARLARRAGRFRERHPHLDLPLPGTVIPPSAQQYPQEPPE
jgi:hypothetical protein